MLRKQRSIQSLLTTYFVFFATLLLVLTVLLTFGIQFHAARTEAMDQLGQVSLSVADSVEQQINQMDLISQNAIGLPGMQAVFAAYTSGQASSNERSQQRTQLVNLMTTARGLDFSIRQLNVYTIPGQDGLVKGYGVGQFYGELEEDADSLPWYEAARAAKGRLVLSVPNPEQDASPSPLCLSVCRMYYNNLNLPVGFTEVKKYYTDVFSLPSSPELARQFGIYVYDKEGRQIFPLPKAEKESAFSYFSLADSQEISFQNPKTGEREYVSFARSGSHGLIIAASIPRSFFLAQVWHSLSWILVVFLILFVIAFLLALVLSKRISSPIRTIYHFLADEKKDRFAPLGLPQTGIREIDKLTHSINESTQSTKAATETMIALKEREVQAQMLAMQAQMNPHFLYNSLSTIGEMAEEGLTAPVAEMCREVTEIMRYISSNREQRSSLQEELEICDMFLDCIRMRYGNSLESRIEVPDSMLDLRIPKLCIQLLVENAIRSVTKSSPPWLVSVSCQVKEGNWLVTVQDNGPGFDASVEADLRRQMEQILATGALPSLKIQGMGILNIFIRLYLLEGSHFIFHLGNRSQGGAFVTIGGSMEKQTEPNGQNADLHRKEPDTVHETD